jgi:acetyl-CoA C-acetyltransferase
VSELWSGFSAVAASNPFAWTTERLSAREIRTPSETNRMHAFPYTKLMCSNMVVDQGAAVIVCSVDAARRFGIDPERWVYLHAATDAQSSSTLSNRGDFRTTPLIGYAGRRAFALAETAADEMAYVDLYSCFPAAVQLGLAELGLQGDRTPTVTGGLGFAGGPFNSYVLHSIATMMNRLREDPGAKGLVSSIGGFVAKHAIGIYSTEPPPHGFRYADLDPEIESGALPVARRELDARFAGKATVETYAVRYREGEASGASIACLSEGGLRAWASTSDPALLAAMTREELCGHRVAVRGDGTLDAG